MNAPDWWWQDSPDGLGAALRTALLPCEWVYRKWMIRWAAAIEGERVGVPVYSIGNLTVGGTGKTPLAQWLARELVRGGHRPAVVLRGYKGTRERTPRVVADGATVAADPRLGDEAVDSARACPGARVVVSPWRTAGARLAIDSLGADCIVLDDGFQHRYLARDLDVVAVDATRPFGNGHCLPAGPLREPLEALRRADLVVLTRADLAGDARREEIERRIAAQTAAAIVPVSFALVALRDLRDATRTVSAQQLGRVALVSGIAHPQAFEDLLLRAGLGVAHRVVFADHATYTPASLERLRQAPADSVVVTGKDAVKLAPLLANWDGPRVLEAVIDLDADSARRLRAALVGRGVPLPGERPASPAPTSPS